MAVPGDTNSVWIHDAQLHRLDDRRVRILDELLDVRVVGLLRVTDDRE
jgi:hypothetical protein